MFAVSEHFSSCYVEIRRRGCLLLGSVQLCNHNFGLSLGDICKRVSLFSGKCGSETDISAYVCHTTQSTRSEITVKCLFPTTELLRYIQCAHRITILRSLTLCCNQLSCAAASGVHEISLLLIFIQRVLISVGLCKPTTFLVCYLFFTEYMYISSYTTLATESLFNLMSNPQIFVE